MLLVSQIHLKIAVFRCRAQIVLAHQPIEIDRAGRTGIGLVVNNFRNLDDFLPDFTKHPRGVLQRRSHRHIKNNLEFALVVERQHLQHDELEPGQRNRAENQQEHG